MVTLCQPTFTTTRHRVLRWPARAMVATTRRRISSFRTLDTSRLIPACPTWLVRPKAPRASAPMSTRLVRLSTRARVSSCDNVLSDRCSCAHLILWDEFVLSVQKRILMILCLTNLTFQFMHSSEQLVTPSQGWEGHAPRLICSPMPRLPSTV